MRLSKYEEETSVLFNEEEAEAMVYTHNARLKAQLRQMAEEYPQDCVFCFRNREGGESYRISKKLVRIRKPYSEERRKRDREIALAQGRRPPTGADARIAEE